jgi:hypothetical protein
MDDGVRPDFTDNNSWFNIKILMDGTRKNNRKEMGKQSYIEDVREIFKELKIITNHFARAFGSCQWSSGGVL